MKIGSKGTEASKTLVIIDPVIIILLRACPLSKCPITVPLAYSSGIDTASMGNEMK